MPRRKGFSSGKTIRRNKARYILPDGNGNEIRNSALEAETRKLSEMDEDVEYEAEFGDEDALKEEPADEEAPLMINVQDARLRHLNLTQSQVDDWIVIHTKHFDFHDPDGDPHRAAEILVHMDSGRALKRLFGRTFDQTVFAEDEDIVALCLEFFDPDITPCIGFVVANEEDAEDVQGDCSLENWPFTRYVAFNCAGFVPKGDLLCEACAVLRGRNLKIEEYAVDDLKVELNDGEENGEAKAPSTSRRSKYNVVGGKVICDVSDCNESYGNYRSLYRHKLHKHLIGAFKCDICDLKCASLEELYAHHVSSHADDFASFECRICKTDMTHLGGFEAVAGHYKECLRLKDVPKRPKRRFACELSGCDGVFSHADSLDAHMNRHAGLKPYACDECDFATPSRAALKSHRLRHLMDRGVGVFGKRTLLFTCQVCGVQCRSKAGRDLHVKRVHEKVSDKVKQRLI